LYRPDERRHPARVDGVDRRARLEQKPHHVNVPAGDRQMKCGVVSEQDRTVFHDGGVRAGEWIDLRAACEQQARELEVSVDGSGHQRRRRKADVGARVDVGAAVDQQLRDLRVVDARGGEQRRDARRVGRLDVGAFGDQQTHTSPVPAADARTPSGVLFNSAVRASTSAPCSSSRRTLTGSPLDQCSAVAPDVFAAFAFAPAFSSSFTASVLPTADAHISGVAPSLSAASTPYSSISDRSAERSSARIAA
jgi:hypothetical protein